jgi:hypothetical protein
LSLAAEPYRAKTPTNRTTGGFGASAMPTTGCRRPTSLRGSPGPKRPRATRLREGDREVGAVCRFIDAEKATEDNPDGYSVALLCRALGVGRSTYYTWLASQPAVAERQCAEDELADRIREIHTNSRGAYGVPRVHAALRRAGQVINRKKVERIMRERDIRGITRRKRRHLTRQDTGSPSPGPGRARLHPCSVSTRCPRSGGTSDGTSKLRLAQATWQGHPHQRELRCVGGAPAGIVAPP